jgi:hypothetical protein
MRGLFGAVLLVGLLAGCGGTETDAMADAAAVQEASCLSTCQAEYHQCMVENAGNGPGKVLCGYALNECKARCPAAGVAAPVSEGSISTAEQGVWVRIVCGCGGYHCSGERADCEAYCARVCG